MSGVNFHSVTYISTAISNLAETDLIDIITVSRRNNPRSEITGILCFNGTNFMQFLEGERDAVNARIRRIDTDHRHKGMVIVDRRQSAIREFPDWWMASSVIDPATYKSDTDLSPLLESGTVAKETRDIFNNFRSLGYGL